MMGGKANKFRPQGYTTRAELSITLYRLSKLILDAATAQGWVQNDAGQYIYYMDGKVLTDEQTINGVKYFFNTDGTLARSIKVDGYEIDSKGVR